MPEELKLVDTRFSEEVDKEIEQFVYEQIEYLVDSHKDLHQNRIPKWRKLYLGIPAEENKSFPWPNASNIIVQVIGEIVDTIAARVLGLFYATHPLWPFQNYAKDADLDAVEDERKALENFMDVVGYEPSEMDLYRIEGLWYTDAAKLGTAFAKAGWEHKVEAMITGYSDSKKGLEGTDKTLYHGPKVYKLRHEDVLAEPEAHTVNESNFTVHIRTLKRKQLEERGFIGMYERTKVDSILGHPDRSRPKPERDDELRDQGVMVRGAQDATEEWDIYECYFPWWHNERKFRIILSYHKGSRTVLRSVFNFLPDNETPILRARLGYRTDGMYGHGMCEILERYQEGLSQIHNQRIDNATAANTRMLRVSPRARALDANFEIFPFALLIGEKDEVEPLAIADVYQSAFENEDMLLRHVQSRAGISPAISGSGQGQMQKRPNVYSSMGTLAQMQEGNSRVNHEASDFRHAHVQLGSLLTALYAKYGTNGKEKLFGLDSDRLVAALEKFNDHRMRIPIRAATASLNREIEKQSDMLMVGLMQRHYTAVGQLMQAVANPIIPPPVQDYLTKVIQSSDRLMKRILKDFGYDSPDAFIPEPNLPKAPTGGTTPQGNKGGPMAPGGSSLGGAIEAASAGRGGVVSAPYGASTSGRSEKVEAPGGGSVPL